MTRPCCANCNLSESLDGSREWHGELQKEASNDNPSD